MNNNDPLNLTPKEIVTKKPETESETPIVLDITLDDIEVFEHNPRFIEGDKYQKLKEGLRETGAVTVTLNVTKLIDREKYITHFGGGSRLKALKELYKETKDQKYYRIRVNVFKNPGDIKLLCLHLSENRDRSDITFIENAIATFQLKKMYEEIKGKPLSDAEFTKIANSDSPGSIQRQRLHLYRLAIKIHEENPELMESGVGRTTIERLSKAKDDIKKVCEKIGKKEIENSVFFETISSKKKPDEIEKERFVSDALSIISKSHQEHNKNDLKKIYQSDVLGSSSEKNKEDKFKIAFDNLPIGFKKSCELNKNGIHLKKPIVHDNTSPEDNIESAFIASIFYNLSSSENDKTIELYIEKSIEVWGNTDIKRIKSIPAYRMGLLLKSIMKLSGNITIQAEV